jgi:uncharacterized protein (TIGR03437 family)
VRLTLNDAEVILDYVSDSQINFRVPQAITPGPATLRLNNGATNAFALALPVEGARPVIQTLLNAAEEVVDAGRPVNAGDGLTAVVGGMGAEAAASLTRVQVTVSGVPMAIQQITPAADNTYRVQFTMVQSFAGSAVPLVVSADGWRSSALTIVVK